MSGRRQQPAVAPELVIRGGTVVDGTGRPGYLADVAVARGRVVDIGLPLHGDVEVDATGCVVSPGFIDIHTHYDAQVFWDPALTPSCFHGVTTVVAGNCGFSIAPTRPEHRTAIAATLERVEDMNVATLLAGIPWDFETFPEYLSSVARRGVGLNYANYLGHTPLRLYVMGDAASERPASTSEIDRMAQILRDALHAGAAGFATIDDEASNEASNDALNQDTWSQASGKTRGAGREMTTMMTDRQPMEQEAKQRLGTGALVRQIVSQAEILVKKELELAKTELRVDLHSEARVAGGLGIAALAGLITINLLLVTAALALSLVMPAWAAGLIVSGVMLAVAAIFGLVSWRRRLRDPLAHTRRTLKDGVKWTKERFA